MCSLTCCVTVSHGGRDKKLLPDSHSLLVCVWQSRSSVKQKQAMRSSVSSAGGCQYHLLQRARQPGRYGSTRKPLSSLPRAPDLGEVTRLIEASDPTFTAARCTFGFTQVHPAGRRHLRCVVARVCKVPGAQQARGCASLLTLHRYLQQIESL